MKPPGHNRRVLMLQGPCSFFFTYLGRALRARGAEVHRVLLCPGDRLFWRGGITHSYRGRPGDWRGFIEDLTSREEITDLVCLGDGRHWHGEAIATLRPLGVRIHVIEQGYLRPHRLTLEPDGTGGNTRFPRDWQQIEELAGPVAKRASYRSSFVNYAVMDVAWNLANLLVGWAFYPHYRPHSIDGPLRDWRGWIAKAVHRRTRQREARAALARIAAHQGPVFVMALQLETDFQIRLHGPDGGLSAVLDEVLTSFEEHAPADALLVVKQHPLDNGLANWRSRVAGRARVVFLDGGDLNALLGQAAGLVTVNSTVGLTALQAGVPTVAMGTAIYDLPGLTHQSSLHDFWTSPAPVDSERVSLLVHALEATIQVSGDFDGTGAEPGAAAVAERLLAPPPNF
ncbi:MAG: capsular biosynthesis protein [Pseudomonadota bacterium]